MTPIARVFERCPSTQDELRELALAGAAAFSTVRADEQTAGRGRRGRTWSAPAGSALLASVLLRPARPAAECPPLALLGGIAACHVARDCGCDARLLWPNDVVVGDRKLAGVLAELIAGPAVLLGVGLNITADPSELPRDGRLAPTSLRAEQARTPSPDALLAALLRQLGPLCEAFDREGFAGVAAAARALDATAGRSLTLRLGTGDLDGVGSGIADDGRLVVRSAAGASALASGEVVRLELGS